MPRRNSEILLLDDIKYVFNVAALQPGDILLMNTYHEVQRKAMVRAVGSCIYDHAALYLGDAFLMEANGLGVVMNHIYSYGFKAEKDACVLRMKQVGLVTLENVVYNAKTYMGMEFGSDEAKVVSKNKDTDKEDTSNRTFCSRLVAQCYSKEGIYLFKNPNYCTPDDYLKCTQLYIVEPSVVPFTEEMAATIMNAQNQRDDFDTATYWAKPFQQFSELYGEDIQTMGQLVAAASKNTDKDRDALQIISNNHLFQPVGDRKAQWSWFDDDEAFFHHFPTTEKLLFFINCQLLHYDLTYIPTFKQAFASNCVAEYICPQSKVIARIKQGFTDIQEDAIYVRKRLAYLYIKTIEKDKDGFDAFAEKYGFNKNYEYQEIPINIDHILRDMIRASLNVEKSKN